ncbi:MAG: flagellar motor switch protein FliN, partial [Dehalococcoidia bacterium]
RYANGRALIDAGGALAIAPARAQAGVRLDAALPPSAPQAAPSPLVLDDAPAARAFNAGNVSPIRPAATVGRVPDDVDVHPVRFPTIGETPVTARVPRSLELLMDVEMRVSVELGRSSLSVEEILSLGPGSVVELNKLAGEPVDILVNDHLIARGEVVVVDENFGVRLTEIVSAHKRVHVMAR